MIDQNLVKEKYASMSDRELIGFMHSEADRLTTEAGILLKAELAKRQLGLNVLDGDGNDISLKDSLNQKRELSVATWNYILEEKEKGKSNNEILQLLNEDGADELLLEDLIPELEQRIIKELQKADITRITGILLLMSGIAITFLPVINPSNPLLRILAWCLILYGGGRSIKGLFYQSRFKRIFKNLKN